MKKGYIYIIAIALMIGLLFLWNKNVVENAPEFKCRESGGGWAPAFFGGNEGPLNSEGRPITSDDSSLIDGSDGYTCYCHVPKTGWNGEACVPIENK